MLTHRAPYPPDRGDRIRAYHLLRTLSKHFDVSLACTTDEPAWLQYHQALDEVAEQVAITPISPLYTRLRGGLALLRGQPVTPASFYRDSLADTIVQWHRTKPFDAVLTFCTGMIQYARLMMNENNPPKHHVLDLVDVDSAKWDSYAEDSMGLMRWVYRTEAKRLRKIEAGQADHIDHITVVSNRERDTYNSSVGKNEHLHVIGNGVDLDYFSPLADCDLPTIAFIGVLNYRPNVDGMVWFVEHVMPLLLERLPDAKLRIIGRHPTQRVLGLNSHAGVEVVGSVPDVREYLRDAAAIIAPLRIARGVQNKVLEAMACQRAVIVSPEAADGVHAQDGRHLLVADSPKQWAQRIDHVLTNAPLRQRLAKEARAQVELRYNWNSQLHPMIELLGGYTSQ
jgi:sugar transferase (PEP-CTERM/EpsH1 system associated)